MSLPDPIVVTEDELVTTEARAVLGRAFALAGTSRRNVLLLLRGASPSREVIQRLGAALEEREDCAVAQPRFAYSDGTVAPIPADFILDLSGPPLSPSACSALGDTTIVGELPAACVLVRGGSVCETDIPQRDDAEELIGLILCSIRRSGGATVVVNSVSILGVPEPYLLLRSDQRHLLHATCDGHAAATARTAVGLLETLAAASLPVGSEPATALVDARGVSDEHREEGQAIVGFASTLAASPLVSRVDVVVDDVGAWPALGATDCRVVDRPTGPHLIALSMSASPDLERFGELHTRALIVIHAVSATSEWDRARFTSATARETWRAVAAYSDGFVVPSEEMFIGLTTRLPAAATRPCAIWPGWPMQVVPTPKDPDDRFEDAIVVVADAAPDAGGSRLLVDLADAFPYRRIAVAGTLPARLTALRRPNLDAVPEAQVQMSLLSLGPIVYTRTDGLGHGTIVLRALRAGRAVVVPATRGWNERLASPAPGPLWMFDDASSLVEAVGAALAWRDPTPPIGQPWSSVAETAAPFEALLLQCIEEFDVRRWWDRHHELS